jgi:flagellar basal body-associated protein FliL
MYCKRGFKFMSAFNKFGKRLKDLSPAAIREIIVVIVILCLAIALSFPQFMEDSKKAKLQKETQQTVLESSTK